MQYHFHGECNFQLRIYKIPFVSWPLLRPALGRLTALPSWIWEGDPKLGRVHKTEGKEEVR